jgi:hypothetical protein
MPVSNAVLETVRDAVNANIAKAKATIDAANA